MNILKNIAIGVAILVISGTILHKFGIDKELVKYFAGRDIYQGSHYEATNFYFNFDTNALEVDIKDIASGQVVTTAVSSDTSATRDSLRKTMGHYLEFHNITVEDFFN